MARLLDTRTDDQLEHHPLRGALFETCVFGELFKAKTNGLAPWDIYFWRDHGGIEVDFILESGSTCIAVEAKSSATFHPDFTTSLSKFSAFAGSDLTHAVLVYGGSEAFTFKGVSVVPWNRMEFQGPFILSCSQTGRRSGGS